MTDHDLAERLGQGMNILGHRLLVIARHRLGRLGRIRADPARLLYDSLPIELSMAATCDCSRRSHAAKLLGRPVQRSNNEVELG